jgi:hypothetical protein
MNLGRDCQDGVWIEFQIGLGRSSGLQLDLLKVKGRVVKAAIVQDRTKVANA